jgi:hypothetical protein
MCLAGGVAIDPKPNMAYTPFVSTPHNYYTIAIQGLSLGGKRLVINPVSTSSIVSQNLAVAATACLQIQKCTVLPHHASFSN